MEVLYEAQKIESQKSDRALNDMRQEMECNTNRLVISYLPKVGSKRSIATEGKILQN